MSLATAAMLTGLILLSGRVSAEAGYGLYVGAAAGAHWNQDQHIGSVGFPFLQVRSVSSDPASNLRLDPGFTGLASVGYRLGGGLRLELEGSYRINPLSRAGYDGAGGGSGRGNTTARRNFRGTFGGTISSADGDQVSYGAMINAVYDIDLSVLGAGSLPFVPYLGVGAGFQWVQHRNARLFGNTGPLAQAPDGYDVLLRSTAGQGRLAYQAMAGLSFPIASVPGLALTAEYRFVALPASRTYDFQYFSTGPTRGGLVTRARVKFEGDYNHGVMLGIRYSFNAAPPPPDTPALAHAAQSTSRQFLVLFDWYRADLTDRARQVISEAAEASARIQVTRIEVSGHADGSFTPRYNEDLSTLRAQKVAAELVRLGVAPGTIVVQAFSSTRPLVPTGAGVREPQNRRVQIVMR